MYKKEEKGGNRHVGSNEFIESIWLQRIDNLRVRRHHGSGAYARGAEIVIWTFVSICRLNPPPVEQTDSALPDAAISIEITQIGPLFRTSISHVHNVDA